MSVKYELLQDCRYGLKGDIITAAAQSRLADMNNGMGKLYVEPKQAEPEPKPVIAEPVKVEKKPEAKKVVSPKPKQKSAKNWLSKK